MSETETTTSDTQISAILERRNPTSGNTTGISSQTTRQQIKAFAKTTQTESVEKTPDTIYFKWRQENPDNYNK